MTRTSALLATALIGICHAILATAQALDDLIERTRKP